MSAARTLFVSTFAPVFGGGRALRTYTCVRALALLGPVDLAYVAHESDSPAPEYEAIDGISFHRIHASRGFRRGAVYLSLRARGYPDLCSRGTSPELIEVAERLARAPGRGRVVAGDTSAATAMMPLARERPVIYNAHNIESEYVDDEPGLRSLARIAMRRYESRLLTLADESWMVSRTDMTAAAALAPASRLRYVPNVADVRRIEPAVRRPGPAAERYRLLMVGDFNYKPNMSGLTFLVQDVLPRVWASRPEVTLTLVGRGLDEWDPKDPRIRVTGFVRQLDPFYMDADCVVVPLTEGAGTPLKFVEALAYAMPVVATPLAAKGLEVAAGTDFLQAQDAQSFADGILDTLRDGGAGLAANARLVAEREYSVESLAERLRDPSLDRVAPATGEHRAVEDAQGGAGSNGVAPLRFVGHAAGTVLGRRFPFVLCYHGVGPVDRLSDPNKIFVERSLFESHLDVIAERGYELIPVGELWARIAAGENCDGLGSITFDDGLVKTVCEAVPLLLDRGVRCSMFLPTGLLGSPHPDVSGEMIIGPQEARELAASGVEVGAHSVDHVRLSSLNYADALGQMRRSRLELEDVLGAPVTAMAYPFGAFDGRTMAAAREAGYEIACACSGPGPWRAMSVPREPVFGSATALRLRLKMAGLYGPAYALVGKRGPLHRRGHGRISA